MVGLGEPFDEFVKYRWGALSGVDALAPLDERGGVDTAKGQPSIDVFERDEQTGWMRRQVGGDPLPMNRAVLAAEMVIVEWMVQWIHRTVGENGILRESSQQMCGEDARRTSSAMIFSPSRTTLSSMA